VSPALRAPAARKSLGQHFLHDTGVLADIAAAVRVPDGGAVLEIGPGTGQLTAALLARGHDVVALEIEPRMLTHLRRRFRNEPRLRLVEGDARDLDVAALMGDDARYAATGNLPYYAAKPIVQRLLAARPAPADIVVMLQREVARELAAPAGGQSLLAVSVAVFAEAAVLFDVPPEAFDPPPKVHSGVVRLTPREVPLVPAERRDPFFRLVQRTFRNPRKQLHNALTQAVALPKERIDAVLAGAAIDPQRRPETLSVAEWLALLDACEAAARDG
jgi:16S rRNA (adenine1518-N6/adenine1519-N6)-dimethyltransferase